MVRDLPLGPAPTGRVVVRRVIRELTGTEGNSRSAVEFEHYVVIGTVDHPTFFEYKAEIMHLFQVCLSGRTIPNCRGYLCP